MNKKIVVAGALALLISTQAFAAAGCKNGEGPKGENPKPDTTEEVMPEFGYETYDNTDFSNYSENGPIECERLPEQFETRGTADPYIFRFNGMYYLYATTQADYEYIVGWKSRDLMNWEQCTGEGLQHGHVSEERVTKHAYAPEVYYFNGKFYMYTSPAGNGHYVLSSDSPEGPFTLETGNIGMSIDGSVFIDDDEKMYFLNAGGSGIEIHSMKNMKDISSAATVLSNTKLGWTEGPMIIKRNGTYFLTYTGVHYLSDGYRVVYSTEQDGNPLNSSNAFARGGEDPILLNVEGTYKGLGHSAFVQGPDLDSYYIVYHNMNLITPDNSWRSMNIDRLIFNGTQMSVDGAPSGSVRPAMPEFSADGTDGDKFTDKGGKKISSAATGEVFSAEYNFTGDNVKCISGYTDEDNYVYVSVDYGGHKISLNRVKGGKVSLFAEGELKNDFDADVIHTVRIAYADGVADVYFDNMCKIRGAEINIAAGNIGYDGGSAHFTAFSNVARGSSDRKELKQSGAQIGAQTFLPEGEYEGLTSYKLTGGSKVGKFESEFGGDVDYNGVNTLRLAEKDDFARYSVYFRESGKYALALTYDSQYGGTQIGVQVNLGEVKYVKLPEVYAEDCAVVTAVITELNIRGGANVISFYGGARDTEFISFAFTPTGAVDFEQGETEYTTGRERSIKYFGGEKFINGTAEVEVRVNSFNGASAGLILRADNFANSQYDDVASVQGYYIGINSTSLFISRYNYNYSKINLQTAFHGLKTGEWVTLKAELYGNSLTVYLNDAVVLEYTDARAALSGYAGIYGTGAEVTFRQITIKSE